MCLDLRREAALTYEHPSSSTDDLTHTILKKEPVREGTNLRVEDEREPRGFAGATGRP